MQVGLWHSQFLVLILDLIVINFTYFSILWLYCIVMIFRMETIIIDGVSHRYYVMGCKMGFDEDEIHEFKGHLNFTKDQIPPYAHDPVYDRPSRQPISKLAANVTSQFYSLNDF